MVVEVFVELENFILFWWRVLVPVFDGLHRRVPSISPVCRCCGFAVDSLDHALWECKWALETWGESSFAWLAS